MAKIQKNGMQYEVEPGMHVGFLYEKDPLTRTPRRGKVVPNNARVSPDKVITLDVGLPKPKAFTLSKIVGDISEL